MKSRKVEHNRASSTSTRAVGQFFDIYAANFDAIYGHTKHRSALGRWIDRTFRQVMVHRFEETLRQTEKPAIHSVLDIGCGPGRYTAAFALQGKEVIGIDIAEEMLKIAQDNIHELNVTADLVLGDYLSVHFDRVFDAACLMGFFDYIEDPVPVLKKIGNRSNRRVLRELSKIGRSFGLATAHPIPPAKMSAVAIQQTRGRKRTHCKRLCQMLRNSRFWPRLVCGRPDAVKKCTLRAVWGMLSVNQTQAMD